VILSRVILKGAVSESRSRWILVQVSCLLIALPSEREYTFIFVLLVLYPLMSYMSLGACVLTVPGFFKDTVASDADNKALLRSLLPQVLRERAHQIPSRTNPSAPLVNREELEHAQLD